jgi:hypothetical protein
MTTKAKQDDTTTEPAKASAAKASTKAAKADDGDDEAVTTFEGPGVAVTVTIPGGPPAEQPDRSDCVVDDGTPHTGRAVNGVVCSRHAMHYQADGTPRSET